MTQLLHTLVPRRRAVNLIKLVAITVLIYYLVDFGFKQDANDESKAWSLDRQPQEKFQAMKAVEERKPKIDDDIVDVEENNEENKIIDEFLKHIKAKEAETRKPYVSTKKIPPEIRPQFVQVEVEDAIGEVDDKNKENAVEPLASANAPGKKANNEPQEVIDAPGDNEENTAEKPGEFGEPVTMPPKLPPEIKKLYDEGWKNHQFNQYVSDRISLRRNLDDFRTDYCKVAMDKYTKDLPATSVIIIFHNEAWSTLLRSVHSVIDRTPEHLLTEVILVDDFSDMDHLKKPLEDYIENLPKVKLFRLKKREGLIRARIEGAVNAIGPVLTFLDSHIEATVHWIEPLLDRIAIDPTNVVCPLIEAIDDETFKLKKRRDDHEHQVGGFDWGLIFRWVPAQPDEKKRRKDRSEPLRSPTMAGGLFSIDKAFFEKLGMYDPGFDIWGCENLELSFKTWMCGGTLEIIPCSHVGHIFRKKSPYKWRPGVNVGRKNSVRLAEVWMDEYSKFYYMRTGNKKDINYGDISSRVKLRADLQCKSFKWYLDNIYPEIRMPTKIQGYGEFKNLADGGVWCLDATKQEPMTMYRCHGQGGHQYFEYDNGRIRRDSYIMAYEPPTIMFLSKPKLNDNQIWYYDNTTMKIIHKQTKKCLTMMDKKHDLILNDCLPSYINQEWQIENLDPTKLLKQVY